MTDLPKDSSNLSNSPATLAADLLHHYGFEQASWSIDQQIDAWLERYPDHWLPNAVIEALYQGRYKSISVEQILVLWHRRGQPIYHFNHEFERLICGNLPQPLQAAPPQPLEKLNPPAAKPALSYRKMLSELPGVKAASRLERLNEIPSLNLALMRSGLGSHLAGIDEVTEPTNIESTSTKSTNNGSPRATVAVAIEQSMVDQPAKDQPATAQPAIVQLAIINHDLEVESMPPPSSNSTIGLSDREFKEFKQGVVFGLSSGLAVEVLTPQFRLKLSQHYKPNWMQFLTPAPIDQFTPMVDRSEFHSKLKSVAQPQPLRDRA